MLQLLRNKLHIMYLRIFVRLLSPSVVST